VEASTRLSQTDEAARQQVSEICGYPFRSSGLVREALTHCSRSFESSYQRLEFLGDAVLDYAVTTALYAGNTAATPGAITIARQKTVSNNNLARRCVLLGLHGQIRHLASSLAGTIADTVHRVEAAEATAEDLAAPDLGEGCLEDVELDCAGAGEQDGLAKESAVAPEAQSLCKVCADVMESLIGAVFVDASAGPNAAPASSELPEDPAMRDAALQVAMDTILKSMVPLVVQAE